jgi:hypothetical protein
VASLEHLEVGAQLVDLVLGRQQRLRERSAPSAVSYEVGEILQASLSCSNSACFRRRFSGTWPSSSPALL